MILADQLRTNDLRIGSPFMNTFKSILGTLTGLESNKVVPYPQVKEGLEQPAKPAPHIDWLAYSLPRLSSFNVGKLVQCVGEYSNVITSQPLEITLIAYGPNSSETISAVVDGMLLDANTYPLREFRCYYQRAVSPNTDIEEHNGKRYLATSCVLKFIKSTVRRYDIKSIKTVPITIKTV